MTDLLLPVILCGGAGMRLWPLSREAEPKQFLALGGSQTLLQQTALRLQALRTTVQSAVEHQSPMLVTHKESRFLVAGQLAAVGIASHDIVLEPAARNTAPALTLAALHAQAAHPGIDPVLLVTPADHVIADPSAFASAVALALPAALQGAVITFGVVPDRPETGYGYIEVSDAIGCGQLQAIQTFVEKPDAPTAAKYLQSGRYLWNAGLFMLRASTWLAALRHYRPDVLAACEQAMATARRDEDFVRPDAAAFAACPSDSIDYAVMEKLPADRALGIAAMVAPLQAGDRKSVV